MGAVPLRAGAAFQTRWSSRLCFGHEPHDTWPGVLRRRFCLAVVGVVVCCCGQDLGEFVAGELGLVLSVCQIPLELFNMTVVAKL